MAETIINSNQLRQSGDTSTQTLIGANQIRQSGDSSSQTLINPNQIQSSGIEYLQSDGAIYIPLCESGETLNIKSFKIDIEYLEMDAGNLIYFGRYYSVYGSSASYGLQSYPNYIGPGQQDGWLIKFYDRNPSSNVATPFLNNRRTEEKSFSSQVVADSNWGLFGGYNQGTGTPNTLTFSKCKIWSCILYDENGNEVAHLIPKEENGVLGMYDSVRNKFIAGVGSGSFIAG